MDLFDSFNQEPQSGQDALAGSEAKGSTRMPLAARMRPQNLQQLCGQQHLLGEGKLLRRAIESDSFSSLILYGPPGCGKTSLARVIANHSSSSFVSLNGVEASVADIRRQVQAAEQRWSLRGKPTLLFVDELHRFNRAQQDVLLPHVEAGTLRFIGATTQNPYYAIVGPLLSRSMVFALEALQVEDIVKALQAATEDKQRGLGNLALQIEAGGLEYIALRAQGDVRSALGILELAALSSAADAEGHIVLDEATLQACVQNKPKYYDRKGDGHYDTISAFIKSVRGSDPDAAIYWLAVMLQSGEDINFIARRMIILASEDIGLADSNALRVAMDAAKAVEIIGMPEARITLAHACLYLATAPKSNSSYAAIGKALEHLKSREQQSVPVHLRTPTRQKLNQSQQAASYAYAHDFANNYVDQQYMPEAQTFYTPSMNGLEQRIAERMQWLRSQASAAKEQQSE